MTVTAEQLEAARKEMANRDARIKALEDSLARALSAQQDAEKSTAEMKEIVTGLKKDVKELREVNIENVLKGMNSITAQVEAISARIRRGVGPVSLGPVSKGEFNVVKAIAVCHKQKSLPGCEKEYEAIRAFQDERRNKGMTTVDEDGGWFVPEQVLADVIGPLYRESAFIAIDGEGTTRCSVIQGIPGNQARIPSVEKGAVAYWIGSEAARTIASKLKAGSVFLMRKKLAVGTVLTKEQVENASSQIFIDMTRRDMTRAMAEEVDRSVAYGSGAQFQPRGIKSFPIPRFYCTDQKVYENGTQPVTVTGGNFDFASCHRIDLYLRRQNVPIGTRNPNFATVLAPEMAAKLRMLRYLMFAGQDPQSAPFLTMLPLSAERLAEVIGAYGDTTIFPANIDIGGNARYSEGIRGDFSDSVIGLFGGISVSQSDEAGDHFWNDETAIKMTMGVDHVLRRMNSMVWIADANAQIDNYTYNHT